MPSTLNPYISFRDNTREVMEYYHSVFGGNLKMTTYKEFQAAQDPAEENKIMHAQLTGDSGITIMASDTPNSMDYQAGSSIAMSLSGDDEAELDAYFEKLSAGGTVIMPLAKAAWGDTFGMCIDRFGIRWLFNISARA